jgi:iron(III) transport system substrate-binding protein
MNQRLPAGSPFTKAADVPRGRELRLGARLAALFGAALLACSASLSARADDVLMYQGKDRDQKILAGAKQEGQVVLYSAMIENQALRPLVQGFMAKYPFVRLTYLRADDGTILSKVDAEVRSNHLVADVVEGTGVANAANGEGLLQPYYTPIIQNYPPAYRDPNHIWAPTRISYFGTAYNTRLVKPDQIPKTYQDLLKPYYKGKLAWRIESISGTPLFITNLRVAWGEDRAMAYFKQLAKQQIVNFASGSARTLVDRVVAGEYPFALNIFAHHPLITAAKGAPVWTKLLDPTPSAASTIGVVQGARHPYAALLLIDYILSDEGQKILANADYFPANPDVPPKAYLKPATPKGEGVAENFIDPGKLQAMDASSEKIFQTLFQQ